MNLPIYALEATVRVSVEEMVGMSLLILCHGLTHRLVADRFQKSICTVNRWFKLVLRALVTLGNYNIRRQDRGEVQPEIAANPKWNPFFEVKFRVLTLYPRTYV